MVGYPWAIHGQSKALCPVPGGLSMGYPWAIHGPATWAPHAHGRWPTSAKTKKNPTQPTRRTRHVDTTKRGTRVALEAESTSARHAAMRVRARACCATSGNAPPCALLDHSQSIRYHRFRRPLTAHFLKSLKPDALLPPSGSEIEGSAGASKALPLPTKLVFIAAAFALFSSAFAFSFDASQDQQNLQNMCRHGRERDRRAEKGARRDTHREVSASVNDMKRGWRESGGARDRRVRAARITAMSDRRNGCFDGAGRLRTRARGGSGGARRKRTRRARRARRAPRAPRRSRPRRCRTLQCPREFL